MKWTLAMLTLTLILTPHALVNASAPGDLIKASGSAVYYLAANGKRYVFPTEKTFYTWYNDFSNVKTISDAALADIPIGGNVTYRPGLRLIKVTTDPKVYAVDVGQSLRWITTESLATGLYGSDWSKAIDDIPDTFFINYTIGSVIASIDDYSPSYALQASPTIQNTLTAQIGCSANNPPCPTNYTCIANVCDLRHAPLVAMSDRTPSSDHALDVLVIIDATKYQKDGATFPGYSDLSASDASRVIQLASQRSTDTTGISIKLLGVQTLTFSTDPDTAPDDLDAWINDYMKQTPNPPEAFVVFSKMSISWTYGGYASNSGVVDSSPPYCNEFNHNRQSSPQKLAFVAVVDWHHPYAACGYASTFYRHTRISQTPLQGECRNNSADTCVLRADELYYQCQSMINDLSSDLDESTVATIIHEISHGMDNELYGHFGTPECNVAMSSVYGYDGTSLDQAQRNFGMCPKVLENLVQHFLGCL